MVIRGVLVREEDSLYDDSSSFAFILNRKEVIEMSTPLRAIRTYCLECSAWSPKEAKTCPMELCPLYLYRFGKNPKRSGIGNKRAVFRKKSELKDDFPESQTAR